MLSFGVPRWKAKSLGFRGLSVIPGGKSLHYWMQRHLTKRLPRSSSELASIERLADRLVGLIRTHLNCEFTRSTVFEFGAGRDLAMPLAMSARGAGNILAVDIEPLAKIDLVAFAARHMGRHAPHGNVPISNWQDLKRHWRIEYRSPADARSSGLPDQSVDIAMSIETLEHIAREDIALIFRELRRILRPTGIAVMKIDYGDHYAGFDRSITPFNFLRYSDDDWAPFQSRFQYVNRLRHSEYLDLFSSAGFDIVADEPERRPIDADIKANLAQCFRRFADDDLFTIGAVIVARPSPGQRA